MQQISKLQLREIALDAVTDPRITITVVPAKRKMSDIRTKAFRKRVAEFQDQHARREVA